MPSVMPEKGGLKSLIINPVFIDLALGMIPGMKIKRDILCVFDKDIFGNKRIEETLKLAT